MEKSYSLALGWWAARWIAHIWVIKYIQENNISIKEISWTSMWAVIWACFAIWKTHIEMLEIIKNIKFLKLIDFNLKESLISWSKVYKILQDIFWENLIENTKIPLKIIATNIKTWEKHIFNSGKITDAIRASINLPIIFKPFEINSTKYLDWWLNSNLPILDLDWNDIIAVSVVREKNKDIITHKNFFWITFKTSFWKYNYQIFKKTISIIMKNNEDFSIEIAKQKWKNIILIKPQVWDYEYFDFLKYKEIIDLWYKSCKDTLSWLI